ncbi:MAG: AMP-binding protein [Solirubrobacterales bacterium]
MAKHDLGLLRHCTSAGEPLNPGVIRAWRDGTGGLTIYDGYGQSETTCLVANYRAMPVRPQLGRPVPGWTVEVLGDDGRPAPNDVVGNIAVRYGDTPIGLFVEYHGDAEANAKAFRDGFSTTAKRQGVAR